jgi:hypothetical protein
MLWNIDNDYVFFPRLHQHEDIFMYIKYLLFSFNARGPQLLFIINLCYQVTQFVTMVSNYEM